MELLPFLFPGDHVVGISSPSSRTANVVLVPMSLPLVLKNSYRYQSPPRRR